jgi:hypothetical protein
MDRAVDRADAARRFDFTGQCEEETPWGETFFVTREGKQWVSCTHRPPHEYPAP